jgi:hypothetical protein
VTPIIVRSAEITPVRLLATLPAVCACIAACAGQGAPTSAQGAPSALRARGAAAVSLAPAHLAVPRANAAPPLDTARELTLPAGWHAEAWARVGDARFAAWTPQRQLLVSSSAYGNVIELIPGRGMTAPRAKLLASGLREPQGLAFDTLNGKRVLYVAESNQLDRYVWKRNGTLGTRTVLVRGRVFASGVRNGEGLSFAPDGTLWTAVNQRDEIPYPFHGSYADQPEAFGKVLGQYVGEHPPDEIARLRAGRNLGWPYCNPDPDVTPGAPGTALQLANLPFTPDALTNPGEASLKCSSLPRIERGLPAHSAPLGFHFLDGSRIGAPWSGGAVVAAHGSWDRTPPRPPAVLWLPWERKARTLGGAITLVGGFQEPSGRRWGRPADAVAGPDGSLYVTDDTAGAVYRIGPRVAG